jgi:nicotinamide mononucleotide transporter
LGFSEIVQQFITDMGHTKWYEYLAVFSGIVSVWYSTKENILVYPTGLVSTIIYVFLSIKGNLLGEASVNFYYTIMSLLGWYWWTKKDNKHEAVLHITKSSKREWVFQLSFFVVIYCCIYFALMYYKQFFNEGPIPWADALASASAFTGMWLMTKKKVESWYWWILTNIVSIPLYFVKHYVFTSVYYVVLLVMAIFGLIAWLKKINNKNTLATK